MKKLCEKANTDALMGGHCRAHEEEILSILLNPFQNILEHILSSANILLYQAE